MKVVGYGVCGPNEKFLENTLKEFKRLCDEVVIVSNGSNQVDLIKSYGFKVVDDNREWGRDQWKIKQDLVINHVLPLKPDACVPLDMDEVFSPDFTRRDIEKFLKNHYWSGYFFFVQLWNDENTHNPRTEFWNIRLWKPGLDPHFPRKSLHCGLFPAAYWGTAVRLPFIVKHYGMMLPEDRARKVERYKKYDPNAHFISRTYYDQLESKVAGIPFNEAEIQQKVAEDVVKYKERVRNPMNKPDEKFFYVRNKHGQLVDIPERHLAETLRRPGFTLVSPIDSPVPKDREVPTILPSESLTQYVAPPQPQAINENECEICGKISKSKVGAISHLRSHK